MMEHLPSMHKCLGCSPVQGKKRDGEEGKENLNSTWAEVNSTHSFSFWNGDGTQSLMNLKHDH